MDGLTLIELIGVLAVLTILAAMLLPALIRQMDKLAADQESASLKSISEALQASISRRLYIPSDADWVTTVATELGSDISNISSNARKNRRVFLIDPAFQIGTNNTGLPYRQSDWVRTTVINGTAVLTGSRVMSGGAVIPPVNPRIMVLSSIGRELPAGVMSGIPSSPADFNVLWDWNDAGTSLPTNATWTAWGGRADELRVQRVNLSPLFVRLVLTTYASTANGRFSINWVGTNTVPTSTAGVEGFLIRNSILGLLAPPTDAVDSQQILIRDGSFVYNENVWRGSVLGGNIVAGLDVVNIVTKYLEAPANPIAGPLAQTNVVQKFAQYMQAYTNWANAGFSSELHDEAVTAQDEMMTAVDVTFRNTQEVRCP